MREIQGRLVLDTLEELVDPRHTALVAIDIQNDFCHADGHFARAGKPVAHMQPAVQRMKDLVAAAQSLGVRVYFLRQLTLPDGKSDSPAWLRFKTRDGKAPDYARPGTFGSELVQGLVPGPGDCVVDKFRPDGFLGTTLDMLLRAQRIETVVLLGTTTEGCVESTVRAASYHDYYVVVASDAVASPNIRLHENSLEFFKARYPLHTTDEIIQAFRKGSGPGSSETPR